MSLELTFSRDPLAEEVKKFPVLYENQLATKIILSKEGMTEKVKELKNISGEKFIFTEMLKNKLKFWHKNVLFSLARNLNVERIFGKSHGKTSAITNIHDCDKVTMSREFVQSIWEKVTKSLYFIGYCPELLLLIFLY